MAFLRPVAVAVEALEDYRLLVTFDTGERRVFDVTPYLSKRPFEELKSLAIFHTVKPAVLSIEWIHGQDVCPDDLYYNSEPI